MDKIIALITDPVYWFSVVFVGLLLSVIAAFLYDKIKEFIGLFSSKQRERNEREKKQIEIEANLCASSTDFLVLAVSKLHTSQWALSGIFLILIASGAMLVLLGSLLGPSMFDIHSEFRQMTISDLLNISPSVPRLKPNLSVAQLPVVDLYLAFFSGIFLAFVCYFVHQLYLIRGRMSFWNKVLLEADKLLVEIYHKHESESDSENRE